MSFRLKNGSVDKRFRMTIRERVMYGAIGAGLAAAVLMIFYRSPALAAIGGGCGMLLFPLYKRKDVIEKRRRQMVWEFKENLYSISASLRAGESLESAFVSAADEMEKEMYPELYAEWQKIRSQMQLHRRVEDLLLEFADSTETDDIRSFAEIIAVSRRTRGDVTEVIDNTSRLLQEKIEMRQELEVLLARKKVEQHIMNLMPLLVIGLLTTLSPDYLQPLYSSLQGRIVMTVCLALAVSSLWLSRKFSNIAI